MKILFGYNGLEASRAALRDLSTMGLAGTDEIVVAAVVEPWCPTVTEADAEVLVDQAAREIRNAIPAMTVRSVVRTGAPHRELMTLAGELSADVIVVGGPNGSGPGPNLFLGQTTQKILNETTCSVRVSRDGNTPGRPSKLLVAFDGSAGAISAVNTIAERNWPKETEVLLLAVVDSSLLGLIGRFTPQMGDSRVETRFASQWVDTLAASSITRLRRAGITAHVDIRFGNAKDEIVRKADEWRADTIFAGPHAASNSFERYLIGSVSSAVAARAHCSVEIVRS
jgi:nucleotide-binding universal stress UspA family protein